MRLTSIQITNLAAFKDFKGEIPAVAIIEGAHGVGKSSLERIIMYGLGRRPLAAKGSKSVQHDPSILHGTAEAGEATFLFDEGILTCLRVKVQGGTTNKTTREVKVQGKKAWEDAGTYIDDLTNALAYNPMQFRDLSEKDRLEAFLRAAPIEISQEEVLAAAAGVSNISEVPAKPGLDTINRIYDEIYRMRTGENQSADTQAKYAVQLEAALPPPTEGGGDWNAEAKRLRGELATLDASEAEEMKQIGKELQGKKDTAAAERQKSADAIDKEVSAKVEDLEEQIRKLQQQQFAAKEDGQSRKNALSSAEVSTNEVSRNTANAEAKEIKDANAPLRSRLTGDIATADERARAVAQAEGTRTAAAGARAESEAYKAKAKAMTEALERLTELKATVGGRMSVRGVTIASPREGMPVDICREEDGALIPFSSWNDADKDQFCLKMAILFRGPFGLVCVDNMGNFSPVRREAVIKTCVKYAAEKKMQFLLGIANDDGELKITDGEKW